MAKPKFHAYVIRKDVDDGMAHKPIFYWRDEDPENHEHGEYDEEQFDLFVKRFKEETGIDISAPENQGIYMPWPGWDIDMEYLWAWFEREDMFRVTLSKDGIFWWRLKSYSEKLEALLWFNNTDGKIPIVDKDCNQLSLDAVPDFSLSMLGWLERDPKKKDN